MVEHRPVHNSEVYVLSQTPFLNHLNHHHGGRPSPPSPITPAEDDFCCSPIDKLPLHNFVEPAIAACEEQLAVESRLSGAVHLLNTASTALSCITDLYSSDRVARDGFNRAVDAIVRRQGDHGRNGKLVVIGVGKSGHIAKKLVATFNSLAIQAVFLHPTEALHGDLGQINSRNDTLLLITFSGKTPELLLLLPHLDKSLPLILLTSHTRPETCEIVRQRPDTILLPAPIHEPETKSFGVSAPTTSTTVALSVGDALAMVASHELHPSVSKVFAKNHPGGAIGAALRGNSVSPAPSGSSSGVATPSSSRTTSSLSVIPQQPSVPPRHALRDLAIPLHEIPCLESLPRQPGHEPIPTATAGDLLLAAYSSSSGWVRVSHSGVQGVVSPRRIRRLSPSQLALPLSDPSLSWLVTPQAEFVSLTADTEVRNAAEWIKAMRMATATGVRMGLQSEEGVDFGEECVVGVMDVVGGGQGCVGVLEVESLLESVPKP
ncbi:hypothetical protein SMACR_05502 [Sordaria macrospora]|uniref:WGS project CABT00000000 data, contig 2.26 n=2 Tax=Sordaria macrospora TaxID=5147 RepID=F7W3X2_SORMK|nr:uncharacterized protein SMAC_05502 [Sordaria macrospora k-hell]KAA8634270.1 hypothetical protein SMACR_05502 [Sordaria macrospora]KAH7633964.1 hypothetical protein B0T09DRAFT_101189 [Sordaria sp. MPI-SDFR-AT-0083]WPJ59680.1 hypothetical protein SMAC4_05502 [Sordaria macrospora]CCC12325.1 unnamed protein product [Sordaria macrospora k-hell]